MSPAPPPPAVQVVDLAKRFGDVQALRGVSLRFSGGRLHALLGENGAGKSTLVKCLMGYHRADCGTVRVDGIERAIAHPQEAHALGLGMVYQHFTLIPQMTVAENFVLGRADIPLVIDWAVEHAAIREFMRTMPFQLSPEQRVGALAAGEKQKLEILKQLYLRRRFILLDEPTSVLTPDEADEVLGEMRRLADAGLVTVVLITHKLREVMRFAQDVSVLRAGRLVASLDVADASEARLARLMFGDQVPVARVLAPAAPAAAAPGAGASATAAPSSPSPRLPSSRGEGPAPMPAAAPATWLAIEGLRADGDRGTPAVEGVDLAVSAGEIVGIAGVSGNGQKELVEVLAGQRRATAGAVRVGGRPFRGTRRELRERGVSLLTEEPMATAGVRSMSVMENLALRSFDRPPLALGGWLLRRRAMQPFAQALIERYGIRTPSPAARLDTLSGGNVQRTILARELSRDVRLLILQNPCFGLDAAAVAEIRGQIRAARDGGTAVLLISEDLDEIIELSDRILVMSAGRIVHQAGRAGADRYEIGRHMVHGTARHEA